MNEQRRIELELRREIQSLREALKFQVDHAEAASIESNLIGSAVDAILVIDAAQNIIQFNAAEEDIFGYPACEVMGKSVYFLLPELFQQHHCGQILNFGETDSTSRNTRALGTLSGLRANGENFPLEISIAPVTRESKMFYFAILRDVSERTRLEGLLFRQYDSLNSLHQITLALLSHRELNEMLQFIVDEAAKLLGSPYCEILLPEDDELVAKAFTQGTPFPSGNRFSREAAPLSWKVFDSGVPGIVADYSSWGSHNRVFEDHHFHAAAVIPILVGAKCIGVLGFARTEPGHLFTEEDVLSATRFAAIAALAMENSRLYREIKMLATIDELTGIRNRRSVMEIGAREVKRCIRYGRPLSVLMLDADHFKYINDMWGHPVGDMVLQGIAKQCLDQIRTTDTVGRYGQDGDTENIVGRFGGEEFVILLPETKIEQAMLVAERIRSAIQAIDFHPLANWPAKSSTIQVTISIGAASLHPENDSLLELLSRADRALYIAKESGRNRVCIQA